MSPAAAATLLALAAAPLAGRAAEAPFPLPLEARVAFPPTAFASPGRTHLVYELHLTNRGAEPLALERIEVLDGERGDRLSAAEGEALPPLLAARERAIAPGGTAVIFLGLDLDAARDRPKRLRHRIIAAGGALEGAETAVRAPAAEALGPPVAGGPWLAGDGPGNGPDNHHRRGLAVVDGRATISRRFAIDWQKLQNGKAFAGDEHDMRAYPSYGAPLLAVADAKVVAVRDGLPDNPPGHGRDFRPAAPVTFETVPGNRVVLDLGDGRYAHYMHLQPGSLAVKAGDRVRRGQAIGRIGASGDAREPHLHFEVTDSARPLAGEGLPYAIDRYRILPRDGAAPRPAVRALPLDGEVVEFGE